MDNTPTPVVAPPFDPTDMTNIFGWWDPQQGVTTVSGAVSQWNDVVFGGVMSQGTAGSRPTFSATGMDGLAALTMNNSAAHLLSATSLTCQAAMTVITIANVPTVASGTAPTIVGAGSSQSGGFQFRLDNGQKLTINREGASQLAQSTATYPAATNTIFVAWASSTVWGFRINGTADTNGSNSGAALTTGQVFEFFQNVWTGGTAETFNGTIGDIIVTNIASSTAEIQQAEGYLAWKYGETALLPSGHPYKSVAP